MEENNTQGMNKKNVIIIVVIAAAVIALIIAVAAGGKDGAKDSGAKDGGSAQNAQTQATERTKVTPTFMYFVSAADENHEADLAAVEELKTQYEGRINFDIKDVDAQPELLDNFPVGGNTPALIMLDIYNDISAIAPKCGDKAALASYIEAALNK